MDRMLYVAMSGATETMNALSNNTNNLANANTTGFQQDLDQFRSMPVFGDGQPTRVYAMTERPQTDFGRGAINSTGRDLDVAVKGDGWIAIQAPDGSEAYTRRGDLKIDVNGLLVTGNGLPVIGNGGPIALPEFEKLDIGSDGTISIKPLGASSNELATIDRIKLVALDKQNIEKGLDGLVHTKDGEPVAADAGERLANGVLESSNVNTIKALVDMIELNRRFQMQVKMMETSKKVDEQATSVMRSA